MVRSLPYVGLVSGCLCDSRFPNLSTNHRPERGVSDELIRPSQRDCCDWRRSQCRERVLTQPEVSGGPMRFSTDMTHLATTRAAAALAALFLVAAPAAAQTDDRLARRKPRQRAPASGSSPRTVTASGGGRTMRHPDAGAAKITTRARQPRQLLRGDVHAPRRRALPARGSSARPTSNYWGNDSVFVQFSGSVTFVGLGDLAHRHDLGDRSESRGLQRLRALRLEVAGQRLGHGRRRPSPSTSRPPAPSGCASRRAKTGCRSTRSC